jgi:hypothetical protein
MFVECVLSRVEKVGVSFSFFAPPLKSGFSPVNCKFAGSHDKSGTRPRTWSRTKESSGVSCCVPPALPPLPPSHTRTRVSLFLSRTHSPSLSLKCSNGKGSFILNHALFDYYFLQSYLIFLYATHRGWVCCCHRHGGFQARRAFSVPVLEANCALNSARGKTRCRVRRRLCPLYWFFFHERVWGVQVPGGQQ